MYIKIVSRTVLLRMRKIFQTKFVQNIKITYFIFNNVCPEIVTFVS
jgi:hypothetical protein